MAKSNVFNARTYLSGGGLTLFFCSFLPAYSGCGGSITIPVEHITLMPLYIFGITTMLWIVSAKWRNTFFNQAVIWLHVINIFIGLGLLFSLIYTFLIDGAPIIGIFLAVQWYAAYLPFLVFSASKVNIIGVYRLVLRSILVGSGNLVLFFFLMWLLIGRNHLGLSLAALASLVMFVASLQLYPPLPKEKSS